MSVSVAQVPSQQTPDSTDRDHGIELYQQGDASGAIETLRRAVQTNEKDGTAWHYLGLAYLLKGSKDDARKSFARAVTIREAGLQPSSMVATTTPDPASARQKRSERFQATAESLEKYLELSKNSDSTLLDELESLRWFRDYFAGKVTRKRSSLLKKPRLGSAS